MENYPFHRCYHPKVITNPNNGKEILTCCGHCKACLLNKANKMSFLCALEEQDHKYNFFVTLTYSNGYIPLMKPVRYDNHDGHGYLLKNCCSRLLDEYGEWLGFDDDRAHKDKNYMSLLLSKCKLGDCLAFANARDLDLFLKRFRKNLSKYSNEKIRYYVVSEYGPRTFRPHYHLLFFFDSEQTKEAFINCLLKSWTYGRVDASQSRGGASSYVASYVNSTCSIPPIFTLGPCKPFAHHSIGFAKGFYLRKKKEIYESSFVDFIRQSRVIGSRITSFMPWRSLTTTFFPRCQDFDSKSNDELYYAYTILPRAYEKYYHTSISQLAKMIYRDIVYNNSPEQNNLQFFRFFISENPNRLKQSRDARSWISKISSMLYCSKHFIEFVCETDYEMSESNYLTWVRFADKIISFYTAYNYIQLIDMYLEQQSYYLQYSDKIGYSYFYDNFPLSLYDDIYNLFWHFPVRPEFELACHKYYDFKVSDFLRSLGLTFWDVLETVGFEKNPAYLAFRQATEKNFRRSIKHKELNDLNNYFIYD